MWLICHSQKKRLLTWHRSRYRRTPSDEIWLRSAAILVVFVLLLAKMATGSELDRVRISAAELRAEASSSVISKDSQQGKDWLDRGFFFLSGCALEKTVVISWSLRRYSAIAEQSWQVCALLMLLASELHQRYLWYRAFCSKSRTRENVIRDFNEVVERHLVSKNSIDLFA